MQLQKKKKLVDITRLYHFSKGNSVSEALSPEDISSKYSEIRERLERNYKNYTARNKRLNKKIRRAAKKAIRGDPSNLYQFREFFNTNLDYLSNIITQISHSISDLYKLKSKLNEHLGYEARCLSKINHSYMEKRDKVTSELEGSKQLSTKEAQRIQKAFARIDGLVQRKRGRDQAVKLGQLYLEATNNWIAFGENSYLDLKEKTKELEFYVNVRLQLSLLTKQTVNRVMEAYSLLDGYFKNMLNCSKHHFKIINQFKNNKFCSNPTFNELESKLKSVSRQYECFNREAIQRFDKVMGLKEEEQTYAP